MVGVHSLRVVGCTLGVVGCRLGGVGGGCT